MLPRITDTQTGFFYAVNPNMLAEQKRAHLKFLSLLFNAIELLGMTAIFYFLYFYRISIEFQQPFRLFSLDTPRFWEYSLFYVLAVGLYFAWTYRYRIYAFDSGKSFSDELYKVIRAYSFAVLITVGVAFLLKIVDYSRVVVISYWIGGILYSGLVRLVKRITFVQLAKQGKLAKNVLIVGAGKVGAMIAGEFLSNPGLGYRVIGFADDGRKTRVKGIRVLGKTDSIKTWIDKFQVDEIIITIPSERETVNRLITEMRKYDIQIKIIPDLYNMVTSSVEFGHIHALPYVTLVKTPMRGMGLLVKRVFDLVATCLLLIILAPLMLLTALAIKLDSKGPIIYKQQRVGRNGQLFYMYKFRSMVENAEQIQEELWEQNDLDGPVFKMKDDPRLTRLGRFLRKYSIDELPQLFNVLKGEMSLVGPRPPLPKEVEQYGDWEWRRLEVIPGITGLWQVSGRSELSFDQWVNLDVYYIENWSLALDLKILLKTVPAVLRGEGAY